MLRGVFMSSISVRKSLVLNSVEEGKEKAVLTIEGDSQNLNGRVRLYNFGILPKGILTLGIYSGGRVYKAGLTHQSGMLYTFLVDDNIFESQFSCAVVNVYNGLTKPLLFGSSQGKTEGLSQVVGAIKNAQNTQQVEQVLDEYGVDFEDEEKAEIEQAIDREFECEACQNCKYKKYFYSAQMGEGQEQMVEEEPKENKSFYQELKPQIEKLFAENKEEEYLEKIFPNSKWVRVELEKDDYYVFGLIKNEDSVKYICYGVPGIFQHSPPRELSGFPSWLPLDSQNQEGFGYWLTYQDAESGESVKAIVE